MDSPVAPSRGPVPAPFSDGLGERSLRGATGAEAREVLYLTPELSGRPEFELALRERTARLASLHHEGVARTIAVERADGDARLTLVSEHVPGTRLADLLDVAERQSVPLPFQAALCLLRQLLPAAGAMHEHLSTAGHGAIALERIVVGADGQLTAVEAVFGGALERLQYSRERYWRELRVALPQTVGLSRFDVRSDITQIGAVALALLLGRPLRADEYPSQLQDLVDEASSESASSTTDPLAVSMRDWLSRTLQLDPRRSFAAIGEVKTGLEAVVGFADPVAEPRALAAFLTRCCASRREAESTKTSAPAAMPTSRAVSASTPPVAVVPQTVDAPKVASAATTSTSPAQNVAAAWAPSPAATVVPVVPAVAQAVLPRVVSPTNSPVSSTPTAAAATSSPVASTAPVTSIVPDAVTIGVPAASAPSVVPTTRPVGTALPVDVMADPLLAPPLRGLVEPEVPVAGAATWSRSWLAVAAVALIGLTLGATMLGQRALGSKAVDEKGMLVVGTNPDGVTVLIDGKNSGATPLSVSLTPGSHVLELVTEAEHRRTTVNITPGGHVSQFLELPKSAPNLGDLQVRTEPSRAKVTVDGRFVGESPVTVKGLSPGPHDVRLESAAGTVTERVTIEPGATAALLVPLARADHSFASGWIAVSAPADVQVFEGGRLLGSSRSDRIMVSVGRHNLELVNEALGFRAVRTVQVTAGQVAAVRPEWPKGAVALNALPWAEAFIGGDRVGETPIGSVSLPIGTHEIVFRHPELGERRASATVTAGVTTKVSVDLRK